MTMTNISTIAGWNFKVLNLFEARKVFRKNFNDTTKINDTIENNPLLKLFTSVVNNNYCWTLAVNTQYFPEGIVSHYSQTIYNSSLLYLWCL